MTDPTVFARTMVRRALKGALATTDAKSGTAYASMVLVATAVDGSPLLMVSSLARHTQNLSAHPMGSILIDLSNASGDAASGSRVTVMGRLVRDQSAPLKDRFIARHPSAAGYAEFSDFGIWRLEMSEAHLIEGFGRIVTVPSVSLSGGDSGQAGFDAAQFGLEEPGLRDRLRDRWPEVTGFDPEGVDVVAGGIAVRLPFEHFQASAGAAGEAAANCLETYRLKPHAA